MRENNRVALFIDVDNLFISAQNGGLPFNLGLVIDRVRQEGTDRGNGPRDHNEIIGQNPHQSRQTTAGSIRKG